MNLDETQQIENVENNCVAGTLVLNETKSIEKLKEAVITPSKEENKNNLVVEASPKLFELGSIKSPSANKIDSNCVKNNCSTESKISNYCLKLIFSKSKSQADQPITDIESFILPLSIGLNTIGRSDSNMICILNKNLSKKHCCIELSELESGEIDQCQLWDVGSLNRTRINKAEFLKPHEKFSISLNDCLTFGNVKFSFIKMNENQLKEQKFKRTFMIDMDKSSKENPASNGKLNSLFEIQNTLDDTCLLETNGHETSIKEVANETNDKNTALFKLYVADTDPEDGEENDEKSSNSSSEFHLEMSQSILANQSSMSNKNATRNSILIPDTMETTNENEEAETNTEEKIVKDLEETAAEKNQPITDTLVIEQTQIIEEISARKSPTLIEIETVNECKKIVVEKIEKPDEAKETEVQKTSEEKTEITEMKIDETKTEIEKVNEYESIKKPSEIENPEPQKTVEENTETEKSETKVETEKVNIDEKEICSDADAIPVVSSTSKSDSDSEFVIINHEDLKQDEEKQQEEKKTGPNLLPLNQEIIVESTILDVSVVDSGSTQESVRSQKQLDSSQIILDSAAVIMPLPPPIPQIKTKRGRPSRANEQKAPETEEPTPNDSNNLENDQKPRRSSRVSLLPQPAQNKTPLVKKKRSIETPTPVEVESEEANETKGEKKEQIKKSSDESATTSSATEVAVTVADKAAVTNESNESNTKVTRRASVRIRNNQQAAVQSIKENLQAKLKEKIGDEKKRRQSTIVTKEDVTNTTPAVRKNSRKANSEVVEKSEENNDADEEGETVEEKKYIKEKSSPSTKRVGRRKTIAVVSEMEKKTVKQSRRSKQPESDEEDKQEEKENKSKKSTASPAGRKKQEKKLDTYSYDEEDGEKLTKKKRKQPTAQIESEKKKQKSKNEVATVETEAAIVAETDSDHDITSKRGRKRKSVEPVSKNQDLPSEATSSTPKIFFHSKRNRKTTDSADHTTPAKTTKYTSAAENKISNSNSKNNESQLDSSPSKRFRLLKAKSSSEENLNKTLSSSEDEKDAESNLKKKNFKKQPNLTTHTSVSTNSTTTTTTTTTVTNLNGDGNGSLNNSIGNSGLNGSLLQTKKHVSIKLTVDIKESNNTVSTSSLNLKTNENENEIEEKEETIEKKVYKSSPETIKPAKAANQNKRLSLQVTSSTRNSSRSLKGHSVPKIMTTGILLSEKEKQIINSLGGQLVTDVHQCSHLITNKIRKTFKFLCCLSKSVYIVNERWLEESNKAKMFLNPQTYALQDAQFEKQHKFSLQTSILKAKTKPLLQGWKFLLKYEDSPLEELSLNDLKTIIEISNGELIEKELPNDENDLMNCCIIYENVEKLEADEENSKKKVAKIMLDKFLNCILKQSFDMSNIIVNQNEKANKDTS